MIFNYNPTSHPHPARFDWRGLSGKKHRIMETIKQNIEVEIKVTPEKVASLFCSMDADEQAIFFNAIAEDVKTWPSCNFDMQMLYVSDKEALTEDARRIMKTIGDYSEKQIGL